MLCRATITIVVLSALVIPDAAITGCHAQQSLTTYYAGFYDVSDIAYGVYANPTTGIEGGATYYYDNEEVRGWGLSSIQLKNIILEVLRNNEGRVIGDWPAYSSGKLMVKTTYSNHLKVNSKLNDIRENMLQKAATPKKLPELRPCP